MPRRRNCFSTISKRCGAYSSLSSMGNRFRVLFPRACLEDFFHLREREVAFVLGVVKMRREAHARFGTKVDKDLPGDEFAADFISMRTVHGNGSGTLLSFVRRVDPPAARLRPFDKARRHAYRLLADCGNSHLIQNLQSGLASVQRRNVGSAVEIPERVFPSVDGPGFKSKRPAMRDPAGEGGTEF